MPGRSGGCGICGAGGGAARPADVVPSIHMKAARTRAWLRNFLAVLDQADLGLLRPVLVLYLVHQILHQHDTERALSRVGVHREESRPGTGVTLTHFHHEAGTVHTAANL